MLEQAESKQVALGYLALCLAACASGGAPPTSGKTIRPNLVILLTDDQTYNGVSALGNPDVKTPHMDSLVQRGVSFTDAHIFGGNSPAVCAPSRATFMTGRSTYQLPLSVLVPWACPEDERGDCPYVTFPEVFRRAGYTTFGTGKQHNGTRIFKKGFSAGAKIFFGGMHNPGKGGHLKPVVHDFDSTGAYSAPYTEDTFSTELFTDAAIGFIEAYASAAPFLMYVAYSAPHDPRMAPQAYRDMYAADAVHLPGNFLPRHPFDNGALHIRDEMLAPLPRTPSRTREEIAGYYAMISHLDAQIGRILEALQKHGLLDRTIIVLAGDNGLAVGQHGLLGKQNLYEHSTGVPLVFAGPGIPEATKRAAPCYLHDVFPTVCDLAGLPVPDSVTSRSLLPAMQDASASVYDAQLHIYTRTQRAVRQGPWKLILYHVEGIRTTQLFNLERDPLEKANLADRPEYAEKVSALNRIMVGLGGAADDPETWYRE